MNKFITLYSDEFPFDVWEEYCDVLGICNDSQEVKVVFTDVIADGTQH
jgi:hypothetical protein